MTGFGIFSMSVIVGIDKRVEKVEVSSMRSKKEIRINQLMINFNQIQFSIKDKMPLSLPGQFK